MDQNNFNNVGATETREPLPTFGTQPQNGYAQPNADGREPLPTMNFAAQPTYTTPAPQNVPEIEACAGSAFGKALASVIISWLPIGSIIAIILSSGALKLVKRANELAAHYGISAGGKAIAAKILGIVGKVSSIVVTVIYALYFLVLVGLIGSLM